MHDILIKIVLWKLCSSTRNREFPSISRDFSSFRIIVIQFDRHLECKLTLKDSLSRYCVMSLWPYTGTIPVCVPDRFKRCGDTMIILNAFVRIWRTIQNVFFQRDALFCVGEWIRAHVLYYIQNTLGSIHTYIKRTWNAENPYRYFRANQ